MIKVCTICNKEFNTERTTALYCPTCRANGTVAKIHKQWQRAKEREELSEIKEAQRELVRISEERKLTEYRKKSEKRKKKLIASGDPFTCMMQYSFESVEYWYWFQKWNEPYDPKHQRTINGINLYEDNAFQMIVDSIKTSGRIHSILYTD